MIETIRLTMANDLKEFMELANFSDYDIGVHTESGQTANAKSILGLMALDFESPLKIVTDDEAFLTKIHKWAAAD